MKDWSCRNHGKPMPCIDCVKVEYERGIRENKERILFNKQNPDKQILLHDTEGLRKIIEAAKT